MTVDATASTSDGTVVICTGLTGVMNLLLAYTDASRLSRNDHLRSSLTVSLASLKTIFRLVVVNGVLKIISDLAFYAALFTIQKTI